MPSSSLRDEPSGGVRERFSSCSIVPDKRDVDCRFSKSPVLRRVNTSESPMRPSSLKDSIAHVLRTTRTGAPRRLAR